MAPSADDRRHLGLEEAASAFVAARRAAKKARTRNYAARPPEAALAIGRAMGLTAQQSRDQEHEIYAAFLVAWAKAGGTAAFAPAKRPKRKAPPPPAPVRLSNRDAEIRSLRRQITTLKDRLQKARERLQIDTLVESLRKARARLRKMSPKTVAAPREPRLTIRLPRQNYGDDT